MPCTGGGPLSSHSTRQQETLKGHAHSNISAPVSVLAVARASCCLRLLQRWEGRGACAKFFTLECGPARPAAYCSRASSMLLPISKLHTPALDGCRQ